MEINKQTHAADSFIYLDQTPLCSLESAHIPNIGIWINSDKLYCL